MFKTRLISGIVLVVLALVFILTGSWLLWGVCLVLSGIGMFELYRAMGLVQEKVHPLLIAGYAGLVLYYLAVGLNFEKYGMGALSFGVIFIMCAYVFTYPRYKAQEIMAAFFGLFYVGVMLSFIYLCRMLPRGNFLVWLIFLSSWGCDTCAYCVGVLIGKHKMAPVLSPKKSVEGAVGGVVGAILLGVIYALATHGAVWPYALICGLGSVISMVGDLAASAIKRNQEIKDYGTLIPGHGGVLDRFDSVIFTAPVIYTLAVLLAGHIY